MSFENQKPKALDTLFPQRMVFQTNGLEASSIEARKEENLLPLKEAVRVAKKDLETNKKEIGIKIKDYNEKYSAKDYNDKGYSTFGDSVTKRKEHPEEQPLELRGADYSAIRQQILNLEPQLVTVKVATITSREDQLTDLQAIKVLLAKDLKLSDTLRQKESDENSVHMERLITLEKEGRDYLAKQKEWSNRDEYTEALGVFQTAVEGQVQGNKVKFEGMKMDRMGAEDDQALRENKMLFLSILASQTNNFEIGSFPLGTKFQNVVADNKKNFPFIYHEYIISRNAEDLAKEKSEWELKVGQAEAKAGANRNAIPAAVSALIAANASLGLVDRTDATHVPLNPNDPQQYNIDLAKAIEEMNKDIGTEKSKLRNQLEKDPNNIATQNQVKNDINACDVLIENLESIRALALANGELEQKTKTLNEIESGFTREKLEDKAGRKLVIEWSMSQFLKARSIVDEEFGPKGENTQGLVHPTARRELIAMVYGQGVSAYRTNPNGTETYIDSTANDYRWMLTNLYQSPYFNALRQNKHLDAENRDFLILARFANKSLARENVLIGRINEMKQVNTLLTANASDPNALKRLQALSVWWPAGTLTAANLGTEIVASEAKLKFNEDFRKKAEAIMARKPNGDTEKDMNAYKDDMRRDIASLLKDLKDDPVYYQNIVGNDLMLVDGYRAQMQSVEINYNSMDYNEKSRSDYMEVLGIDMTKMYGSYLDYLKVDKDMKVEQWDTFLLKSGNVDKLAAMFEVIIPEGKMRNGKEDFIKTLKTLHGTYPNTTAPKNMNGQSVAVHMYESFKAEIKQREQLADKSVLANAELKSRLQGMTFGDKITEYGNSVLNMLIGPGQSLANRAAGLAMIVAAWKLVSRAYKGEKGDKLGQALRYMGLAAAAELMVKQVTGAGVLDRLKITGVADAMNGTYDAVMLKRGKGLKISTDEHARTLAELKKVPMKSLLAWYRNSTEAGLPIGKEDGFPKEINASSIVRGLNLKEQDSKLRARFVVKQVMRNFLGYVGEKNNGSENDGLRMLEERWIKASEGKGLDLDKAEKTEIGFEKKVALKQFRDNPKSLTWEVVMQAEIELDDLDAANDGSWLSTLERNYKEASGKVSDFIRLDMVNPASAAYKKGYELLKIRYGRTFEDIPKNMVVIAGEKKEDLLVWWKESPTPLRIRRTAENMYKVVETAAVIPFLATGKAAELVSDNALDLVQKLDKRRLEWMGEKFDVTFELFPAGVDINGTTDQTPVAKQQRGLMLGVMETRGYKMFGRFKSDIYESDGMDRKCSRGMLARQDFMTVPDQRIEMNRAEGYVVFAGIAPKGDSEAAYREGIQNLVNYLRNNQAEIDATSPAGRDLLNALNSNDNSLIEQHVTKYVDRFGTFETSHNGQIMFMHFPFPTASRVTTWNKEVIWKGPGMALPIVTSNPAALPANARSMVIQNTKYRGRYEKLVTGEGYPSFEKYKRSLVFSVKDDPVGEGYIEKRKGKWWSGTHIENYMKEFHLWDGDQARKLVTFGLAMVDNMPISEFGEDDNKADLLFAAIVSRKGDILKQHGYERNPTQTSVMLTKYGSKQVADEFMKIHTNLDEYFSGKTLIDRTIQLKDWLTFGDSFKLKYRQFLMENLSELYRDSQGKRKITVADLNKVSQKFIDENRGMVEDWAMRIVKIPNAMNNLFNEVLNWKYLSALNTNPPKRKIK